MSDDERERITARLSEIHQRREQLLLQLAALAGDDMRLWERIDDLGPGIAERAVRMYSRELTAVRDVGDAINADQVEPRMVLGRCGHVFTGTVGEFLCPECVERHEAA